MMMTTDQRTLVEVIATMMYSVAGLQQQCSAHACLISEKLPGLTPIQRKEFKMASQYYGTLAEKSKQEATLLTECLAVEASL
jgi:hypothetical protein